MWIRSLNQGQNIDTFKISLPLQLLQTNPKCTLKKVFNKFEFKII